MKDQAGFSLGGLGGQNRMEANQYDAINRASTAKESPIERARPLEENMRILESVLCQLESRIELLKGKVYPLKSLIEMKGSPVLGGPQSFGNSPLCNSLGEVIARIHNLSVSLEDLVESLEI